MKIIYKQQNPSRISTSLEHLGIENCYLKELFHKSDYERATHKLHHHIGFEMHMVISGSQVYDISGNQYTINNGKFLLVYPNVPHSLVSSAPNTLKYSITFNLHSQHQMCCYSGDISLRTIDHINFILCESQIKSASSFILIENCILEIIVYALRLSGFKELANSDYVEENSILHLSKQYIADNIEHAPSVTELAEYCHLSTKQLTRIFNRSAECSPGEFIKLERSRYIEKLLSESNLSLKEISEKMHFNNDYHFNTFFKKYAGMPPGEYRKMYNKNI